ncbi:hypothetical protein WR25_16607 [Diploscapter pachys]|uniref:Uncharacterized protein n=1 Tax=Diploscapter pachys TaxID=2018661 RepID=A0A2A2KXY5_9BILA|nr:hypothetical protein WR25_16607 [Diploscapter pachys]
MGPVKCRRLEGKVAIVTAATKGIGLGIAERLLQEGTSVVIGSRRKENVDEALQVIYILRRNKFSHLQYLRSRVKDAKVEGIEGHIAKPEDQQKLIDFTLEKFGKIDILVNNHGISPDFGHILDVDDKLWDKLFEVNLKAGFQMTKLVHPHMKKNGGGVIIFNASYTGYLTTTGIGVYGITKTAMLGLVKSFAAGLVHDNIRVNGVAPGLIKTNMSEQIWKHGEKRQQLVMEKAGIKIGRFGEPEDVAAAVAYLVSDDASYVTGETMLITGGIDARL